jgi:hypothetical protein
MLIFISHWWAKNNSKSMNYDAKMNKLLCLLRTFHFICVSKVQFHSYATNTNSLRHIITNQQTLVSATVQFRGNDFNSVFHNKVKINFRTPYTFAKLEGIYKKPIHIFTQHKKRAWRHVSTDNWFKVGQLKAYGKSRSSHENIYINSLVIWRKSIIF